MNATERFSDRVENYVKYRPHYPPEIIPFLATEIGLTPSSVIADIGSGTGISAKLFLRNGNKVFGVEPNKEMRERGEQLLRDYPNFQSITGRAEETGLASNSIDIVLAGQAFHWFDVEKSRAEFKRILKQGGWVVLIWNERSLDATPFLQAYENLLRAFGTDYADVRHENSKGAITALFGERTFNLRSFPNKQMFNYDGLLGRLLSSSYIPSVDQPNHAPMIEELKRIFEKYNENGIIEILYQTDIFYGQLNS